MGFASMGRRIARRRAHESPRRPDPRDLHSLTRPATPAAAPANVDARTARSRRLSAQAAAREPPRDRLRAAADRRRVQPQPQLPRQRRARRELPAQAGHRGRQRPLAGQRGGALPAPDRRRRLRSPPASRGCTATTGAAGSSSSSGSPAARICSPCTGAGRAARPAWRPRSAGRSRRFTASRPTARRCATTRRGCWPCTVRRWRRCATSAPAASSSSRGCRPTRGWASPSTRCARTGEPRRSCTAT